jgi:hypothetical protein
MMSVQFGVLARLTWWEYSWDIMEPVTYFVTYGTGIAAYAYFVLTKQEYLFNDVGRCNDNKTENSISDPGWVKKSGSRSVMNNPDHIFESLETIFWFKILKFFDADPGSGIEKSATLPENNKMLATCRSFLRIFIFAF